MEKATFAAGCFWGVEEAFRKAEGVTFTQVGYIGGTKNNPTYEEVCTDTTGHAEAVEVTFDPEVTSFEKLLDLFWEIHDPTQVNRQGPDVGNQYRSEVFYRNVEQKEIAEKLVSILEQTGLMVATKITPASDFWKAEDYHQDYYSTKGGTPYCHTRVDRFPM